MANCPKDKQNTKIIIEAEKFRAGLPIYAYR